MRGLVALLDDPATTLAHVERDFGVTRTSTRSSHAVELTRPLASTQRVTINLLRAQNREYLRSLTVEFSAGSEPKLLALATSLGVPEVVHDEIRSGCSHGACPSVIGYRRPVTVHQRFVFRLEDAARSALGERRAARFAVKELYVDGVRGGCRTGRPALDPTPLQAPSDPVVEAFVGAVEDVTRLARAPALDEARVQELLSPFGRVVISRNDISDFTWIKLFPSDDKLLPPVCFGDARYVQEPELLCQITYHDRHLYEFDGPSTHRIFLIVQLADAHIDYLEIERMPRGWDTPVF